MLISPNFPLQVGSCSFVKDLPTSTQVDNTGAWGAGLRSPPPDHSTTPSLSVTSQESKTADKSHLTIPLTQKVIQCSATLPQEYSCQPLSPAALRHLTSNVFASTSSTVCHVLASAPKEQQLMC
jgi:hypothetical protein